MAGITIVGFSVKQQTTQYDHSLVYFCVGILFLLLPLIWQDMQSFQASIPKMLMLSGGLIFYFSMLQLNLSYQHKQLLIGVVVLAATIQSVLAFWQTTVVTVNNWMEFNPGTRPYGIFQQINVLASFTATGVACIIYLLLTLKRRLFIGALAGVMCFLIVILFILQSRTGYMGVLLYLIFATLCCGKRRLPCLGLVIMAIALTALAVYWFKQHFPEQGAMSMIGTVNKTSSNSERAVILLTVLKMIALHPFSGWGYGSFEHSAALIAWHYFHHIFPQNVTHPHNELLYEWAEGGILAPLGMLVLLSGYVLPLLKASPVQRQIGGLSIPIMLHTMLEYPLAQSSTHWLLLLLFCRLSRSEKDIAERCCPRLANYLLACLGLAGLLFLLTGFRTGTVLTQFERSGMTDFSQANHLITPWIQWERFEYDRHVNQLMMYNQTHQTGLLLDYAKWAEDYLHQHNDQHVYANLKVISASLHLPLTASDYELYEVMGQ